MEHSEQLPTKQKLYAGQVLLYVPYNRRHDPREVTITKVGRKWAEIDGRSRIDIKSMEIDCGGYSSLGRCWHSRDEYEAHKALGDAWDDLRRAIDKQWSPPAGVGLSQILTVKRVLFKETGGGPTD